MSFKSYEILETDSGPMISDSRTSVYDVLLSLQEGEDFFAICEIYNLQLPQVWIALEYIEEQRAELEAGLPQFLATRADRAHYPRPIAEERAKMDRTSYEILETDSGPMISDSRTSVYDVLQSQQEGESFYAICVIHNLQPKQVEVALAYIEEHRERLEADLPGLLAKKAERERYYRAIAAERQKLIAELPMTPKRAVFYALREKNKHLWNQNGGVLHSE